jgi:hypothetical protein
MILVLQFTKSYSTCVPVYCCCLCCYCCLCCQYNKQHVMPLEDVKIQSLENDGPWKYGWQIISPKKSFSVYAASSTEKAEWMAHINKCITDLLASSMSL